MELGNILVNMRSEAEECSAFLTSGSGSAEQRLKVLATLSDYSRRQGIAAYLDGLDLERFRSCLKRSAEARLRFLKLRTGSGESCYVDAVDALKPFFDAVVCGELALAVQIAEASPDAWREGEEYEEDFCYGQFVFALLREGDQAEVLADLLKRFEEALPKGGDIRLSLCKAFFDGDADVFGEALELFVWKWQEDYTRMEQATPAIGEAFYTERFLSVEGLAWMKLGANAGLFSTKEMPLMPVGVWGE